ncbi:PD40 domain-containing protein [Nonomuraea soli]|uniref:WD40 repeat domain-containing protein n=1 Tax=Nonomuraea soli TaxID=1032476 RepID=A0A7W0CN10_9ACTN|nr:PD40 domain-containing protein [Nonomuraea soli]MBA2894186.1 hypothetical protein [Nonomuraea soli]
MGDFLEFTWEIGDELAGTAYLLTGHAGEAASLASRSLGGLRQRWHVIDADDARDRLYELLLAEYLDNSHPEPAGMEYGAFPRAWWRLRPDQRALMAACFRVWPEESRAFLASRQEPGQGGTEARRLAEELLPGGSSAELREALDEIAGGRPPVTFSVSAPPQAQHAPHAPRVVRPRRRKGPMLMALGLVGVLLLAGLPSIGTSGPPRVVRIHDGGPAPMVAEPGLIAEPLPHRISDTIRYAFACSACDAWTLVGESGRRWVFGEALPPSMGGQIAVSPDGMRMVYQDFRTRKVMIRHVREGAARSVTGKQGELRYTFSANSRWLLVTSGNGPVLFDTRAGRQVHNSPRPGRAVGVSDAGRALLADGDEISAIAPGSGSPTSFLLSGDLAVSGGHLSPDGRTMAFISVRTLVTVDARTGRELDRRRLTAIDPSTALIVGWRYGDQVLVRDDNGLHLVNALTGRTRTVEVPGEIDDVDGLAIGTMR